MLRLRAALFIALFLSLVSIGCNKGGEAKPGGATSTTAAGVAVDKQTQHDLSKLSADFKAAATPEKRTRVMQRAMEMDEAGENVVPTLLELLKDKTAGTLGRTSERPDSTRELVVQTLLSLKGGKGKQALVESGLKTLENGLKDKEPNVREHTVNASAWSGRTRRAPPSRFVSCARTVKRKSAARPTGRCRRSRASTLPRSCGC
jgi:hypothetical protein